MRLYTSCTAMYERFSRAPWSQRWAKRFSGLCHDGSIVLVLSLLFGSVLAAIVVGGVDMAVRAQVHQAGALRRFPCKGMWADGVEHHVCVEDAVVMKEPNRDSHFYKNFFFTLTYTDYQLANVYRGCCAALSTPFMVTDGISFYDRIVHVESATPQLAENYRRLQEVDAAVRAQGDVFVDLTVPANVLLTAEGLVVIIDPTVYRHGPGPVIVKPTGWSRPLKGLTNLLSQNPESLEALYSVDPATSPPPTPAGIPTPAPKPHVTGHPSMAPTHAPMTPGDIAIAVMCTVFVSVTACIVGIRARRRRIEGKESLLNGNEVEMLEGYVPPQESV